jgi:hypothetical protein
VTQSSAPDTGFLFIADFVEISGKTIVSPQLETGGELSLPHTMLGVVFLHLVLVTDRGPTSRWSGKKAAQNAYERGAGCIRLSVVTSLIPTH